MTHRAFSSPLISQHPRCSATNILKPLPVDEILLCYSAAAVVTLRIIQKGGQNYIMQRVVLSVQPSPYTVTLFYFTHVIGNFMQAHVSHNTKPRPCPPIRALSRKASKVSLPLTAISNPLQYYVLPGAFVRLRKKPRQNFKFKPFFEDLSRKFEFH